MLKSFQVQIQFVCHSFLPSATMTVTVLPIILRREGVVYLFHSNNDFITKAKISFHREREGNNKTTKLL